MLRISFLVIFMCLSSMTQAAEYSCKVEKKLNPSYEYTDDEIKQGQYSVLIEENENDVFVFRCSYSPSAKKVDCDRYKMDKTVFDKNVKIKKYYLFGGQFDVQVFPDLSFVENNGRGDIAFGKCKLLAP